MGNLNGRNEMSIRYVTNEEFDAIIERNNRAIALRKKAKSNRLTLAEKLALIREAKALEAMSSH